VYARLTFAALTDYDVVSVVLGDGVLFGRFCFQPAEKLVKPPHVLSGGEVELTQHVHIFVPSHEMRCLPHARDTVRNGRVCHESFEQPRDLTWEQENVIVDRKVV